LPNQHAVSPSSSLRLKGLAQARTTLAQTSSLRLGKSSTHKTGALHAFSLRRDFPRLSETFTRLKPERVAWATLRAKSLGEPKLISPRRDGLAWARLSDLAAVSLWQPVKPNQNHTLEPTKHPEHHINHKFTTQGRKQS